MAVKPLLPHQPVTATGLKPSKELLEALQIVQREAGYALWGQIDGVLSDQVDLQAALNGKANVVHTHVAADITDASTAGRAILTAANSALQTALLDLFTDAAKGLVPASGGGTTNFLRADGTWAAPGGTGGISDGDKGDITVSGGGTVWTIDASVVDTSKLGGDVTAAGKALLDDATAADQRTTLGLGTLATQSGTFSGTSSGTNTGDQNVFTTVAVSGQPDVVADTTSDTLTLAAGSNVTLTTNAVTDTVTIAAAGTDLSYTAATRLLASSTGADVNLPLVTSADAGLAPASGGGTANFLRADATWAAPPATDLTYTAATRVLASSTGTDATLPIFTSTEAGLAPSSGGGTSNFLRADGTWAAPPAGGSVALTDLSDVTITAAAEGQSLVKSSTDWVNQTYQTFTLGPFYINDMAGTATTQATLGYFNTATALSRNGNDVRMDVAGRIVGLVITSDAARTAGTATARVRIAGAGAAFNGGSVALDATNTTSDSGFVAWGSGNAFTAGQTVGVEVTTSGWTPTTANFALWLVVMLKF